MNTLTNVGSFKKGFLTSLSFVVVLFWLFMFQSAGSWWDAFTVHPGVATNFLTGWGYFLFHGSAAHLFGNSIALLVLGTLSFGIYPRATLRSLPLILILSFVFIWLAGDLNSRHLGASGITYGLMALITSLGILRRERASIAAGLIVWFLFAGAWWAMLPGYPDISWQGHLGGAIAGALGALLWKRLDPNVNPPIAFEDDEDIPLDKDGFPKGE